MPVAPFYLPSQEKGGCMLAVERSCKRCCKMAPTASLLLQHRHSSCLRREEAGRSKNQLFAAASGAGGDDKHKGSFGDKRVEFLVTAASCRY